MKFIIKNKKRSIEQTLTWEDRFEVKSDYMELISISILSYASVGDTVVREGFISNEEDIEVWMNKIIQLLNNSNDEVWQKTFIHYSFEFKRKALLDYYLLACRRVVKYYKEKRS